MPLYEYQCESCKHRFERIQKFSDPLVDTCPSCGGPVKKLLSSPAFKFKGSGFYITDYAQKKSSGDGTSSGDTKSDGASKDAPASESSSAAPAKESKDSTTTKKE